MLKKERFLRPCISEMPLFCPHTVSPQNAEGTSASSSGGFCCAVSVGLLSNGTIPTLGPLWLGALKKETPVLKLHIDVF